MRDKYLEGGNKEKEERIAGVDEIPPPPNIEQTQLITRENKVEQIDVRLALLDNILDKLFDRLDALAVYISNKVALGKVLTLFL